MVVESGNFHIRKVKLPYCLTVRKQSFGPHPGKGTPFSQSQSRGNVFEARQYILLMSVTLQEVHTYGTLITQTILELQQLCCVSFSHKSWVRENYSLWWCTCMQCVCKRNMCRTYYWHRTLTLWQSISLLNLALTCNWWQLCGSNLPEFIWRKLFKTALNVKFMSWGVNVQQHKLSFPIKCVLQVIKGDDMWITKDSGWNPQ